jgi:hypothetical protein
MTADASVAAEAPADWDALAVERPGGHVYQSRGWAEHRRARGWRPRYITAGEFRVLALVRDWPLIGGASAYIPRGPAPTAPVADVGAALWAATRLLAGERTDVVAADPEIPADSREWRDWLRRAAFRPIEEIQPSRHRITLPLGDGADEDGVFGGIAKSTRQRIRKAEKEGTIVVRHDTRAGEGDAEGPAAGRGTAGSRGGAGGDAHGPAARGAAAGAASGDGFALPAEPTDAALDRFYDFLLATGDRKDFSFGPRDDFVAWWRTAHAAGQLILLEARDRDARGEPLAGLILYRHGGRLSTVHSGDLESSRRTHPGALHLLRWRAIQIAIRERCTEMDLGGADVAGARRVPVEGEAMYGLYQHKLSFGGQWLELAGAHERVIRPRRYAAGRLVSRGVRVGTIASQRLRR